ncbi:MAG: GNAT family N-acetyltransferase [Proteobacteria bacterium]|nr:GNAT family N-acetyltransferase [Pseudomonadota bacterium]
MDMQPHPGRSPVPASVILLSHFRTRAARAPLAFDRIDPCPEHPDISIRALGADDMRAFRTIALEALNRDGHFFATDLGREAMRHPLGWAAMCAEAPDRAAFGAFAAGRLVGIMAARAWEEDPSGNTVCWGSAFVQPAHRRTGIGRFLYGTREQWSKQRGFASAVMAIRADNARSIAVHSAAGATRFAETTMRYADGTDGATLWFRKPLVRHAS